MNQHWKIDRGLVLKHSANTALMYAIVLELDKEGWKDPDGWIMIPTEAIIEASGLSRYMQDKTLKELASEGLLVMRTTGIPPLKFVLLEGSYDS